jgi:cell division protein FtsB
MQGLVSRIAVGVFGLMTVAMVLLAIFDDRGALAVQERSVKRDKVKAEVIEIQKQNDDLRNDIENFRYDADTIELRARKELKLVKPDEVILQLPVEATPAKEPVAKEPASK